MITTRTPLRITLGGGGSDLNLGEGVCVAATISAYTTITVAPHWEHEYILHYSINERWEHADQIQHRIFRETFKLLDIRPGIQVSSVADVPGGTGLGNSGAFTVGLIRALRPDLSRPAVCDLACRLDIGQQDQWSATYGGLNIYDFAARTIRPVPASLPTDAFALYYTGLRHDAAEILTGPPKPASLAEKQVAQIVPALQDGDLPTIGRLLQEQWATKLLAQPTQAHQTINRYLQAGTAAGAYGGKLVGAGDGGFLLFAVQDIHQLDAVMRCHHLRRFPFTLTHEGSCVI